jgi:hypothetical protein
VPLPFALAQYAADGNPCAHFAYPTPATQGYTCAQPLDRAARTTPIYTPPSAPSILRIASPHHRTVNAMGEWTKMCCRPRLSFSAHRSVCAGR